MTTGSDGGGPSGGERPDDQQTSRIAYGIPIGAGLGVALGLALGSLPLGIAIGAGLGLAFGALLDRGRWDSEVEGPGILRTALLVALVVGVLLLLIGAATFAYQLIE